MNPTLFSVLSYVVVFAVLFLLLKRDCGKPTEYMFTDEEIRMLKRMNKLLDQASVENPGEWSTLNLKEIIDVFLNGARIQSRNRRPDEVYKMLAERCRSLSKRVEKECGEIHVGTNAFFLHDWSRYVANFLDSKSIKP